MVLGWPILGVLLSNSSSSWYSYSLSLTQRSLPPQQTDCLALDRVSVLELEGVLEEEGDREKPRLCPDLCPVSRPRPSCNTLQLQISLSSVKFKEDSLLLFFFFLNHLSAFFVENIAQFLNFAKHKRVAIPDPKTCSLYSKLKTLHTAIK